MIYPKLKLPRKVKKEALLLMHGVDGYCLSPRAIGNKYNRLAIKICNAQTSLFYIGKYRFIMYN